MSASELARKLDVPPNRITAILNGQRAITGDQPFFFAPFFAPGPRAGGTTPTRSAHA